MKLIDALKEIKNNPNKYAKNEDTYIMGYRYKDGKCTIFDYNHMTYIPTDSNISFSENELFYDGWVVKNIISPKYKIGDRFVIEATQGSKISWGSIIWNCVYNAIGTISDIKYDDQYIYTLTYKDYLGKKGTLTKEISEKELSTYDLVVSQDN